MSVQTKPSTIEQAPLITSTVLTVVLRAAGPVTVGVLPHGLGHPERQVSVRIGDVVVQLTDKRIAARIRQRWDASVGQVLRLRERVSQTWPPPGRFPAAVSVHLTSRSRSCTGFVSFDAAPVLRSARRTHNSRPRAGLVSGDHPPMTAWGSRSNHRSRANCHPVMRLWGAWR